MDRLETANMEWLKVSIRYLREVDGGRSCNRVRVPGLGLREKSLESSARHCHVTHRHCRLAGS